MLDIIYRCALLGWLGSAIVAGVVWVSGIPAPASLRIIPAAIFLLLLAAALMRTREPLAFWFPSAAPSPASAQVTLAGRRSWRTFWSAALFLFLWPLILKAFG